MSNTVVGLDIGSSFIKVVIGHSDPETNKIEIIGLAKRESEGLKNGNIVNIDAVTNSIKETIEEAEQNAGVEVSSVYVGVGGSQVFSRNSNGIVGVSLKTKNVPVEISDDTRKRALECSRQIAIPYGDDIIHIIPQEYVIDGSKGVRNPIGMMGVRLEVKTHLVMLSKTAHANIQQCLARAGFNLNGVLLKTLAQAYSVVHDDEMELGSIIIDLGGGTTDVMVINKGAPIFTCSYAWGGNSVTQDIATTKGIPFEAAEKIKVESGVAWLFGGEENEEVIIPSVGSRGPECTNKKEIFDIIVPRLEEIMQYVRHEVVSRSGLKELNGSIILTGGGAMMPGIVEFTQYFWQTSSVRIGCCSDFGGTDDCYRDPDFATAVGIVIANKDADVKIKKNIKTAKDSPDSDSAKNKIKEFFKKLV